MFPMGIIYNNHQNDHVFESSSVMPWLLRAAYQQKYFTKNIEKISESEGKVRED